jgi:hypothetical protein
MTPRLHRIGAGANPIVVIDGFSGDACAVVEIAAALAPFPTSPRTYYPGLRRIIEARDAAAWAYVMQTMQGAAPFVGGGFDVDGFDLIEASFSMVTARPEALGPAQRVPHFDSADPDYIAVLHYLSGVDGSGTAFYRQRSTDIERVAADNLEAFVAAAKQEGDELEGYPCGSNSFFEQVFAIEAVPDRLVMYQGGLLHSGIIPPDMSFSADPREGRLTANFFVTATRR